MTSCDQSHVDMKCHELDAVWSGYTLSGPTQSSHKPKKENNRGNMALLLSDDVALEECPATITGPVKNVQICM